MKYGIYINKSKMHAFFKRTLFSRVLALLASLLDMDDDGMISGEEVARAHEMAAARRRRRLH